MNFVYKRGSIIVLLFCVHKACALKGVLNKIDLQQEGKLLSQASALHDDLDQLAQQRSVIEKKIAPGYRHPTDGYYLKKQIDEYKTFIASFAKKYNQFDKKPFDEYSAQNEAIATDWERKGQAALQADINARFAEVKKLFQNTPSGVAPHDYVTKLEELEGVLVLAVDLKMPIEAMKGTIGSYKKLVAFLPAFEDKRKEVERLSRQDLSQNNNLQSFIKAVNAFQSVIERAQALCGDLDVCGLTK